jgi:hypothetical protein
VRLSDDDVTYTTTTTTTTTATVPAQADLGPTAGAGAATRGNELRYVPTLPFASTASVASPATLHYTKG